jgi:hypothetical protein
VEKKKGINIYKENGEYVAERINEFNHSSKRYFVTLEGLFEYLETVQGLNGQVELEVSEELWATVINQLASADPQEKKKVGRPSCGVTKKVSITLPEEVWVQLDVAKITSGSASMSELLRKIIIAAID